MPMMFPPPTMASQTPNIGLNVAAPQSSPASAHSNPDSGRAAESSASDLEVPPSPPQKRTEKRKHLSPPRSIPLQSDLCPFPMVPYHFDPFMWQSWYQSFQPEQAKRPKTTPELPHAVPFLDSSRLRATASAPAASAPPVRPLIPSKQMQDKVREALPVRPAPPMPDPVTSQGPFEDLPPQGHQAPPREGFGPSDYPSSPGSPASSEAQQSQSSHEPDLPPPIPDTRGSHASSSSDDFSYSTLILQMAQALNLDIEQPPSADANPVFDDINQERPIPLSLPFNKSILQLIKDTWGKTPSIMQISCRTDGLYRTHGADAEFLNKHPVPNSIIVESSQARTQTKSRPTLANKDGRKVDTMAKRIYSLQAFLLRSISYQATMGAFQRHLWNQILPFMESFPEPMRSDLINIHSQAISLAKYQRIAARHSAEAASKTLVTSISIRHHAWLKSSTISDDTKSRIEDLPFDSASLFNSTTDDTMEDFHKKRKTARSYSAQPSSSYQRPFYHLGQYHPKQYQNQRFQPYRQYRPQQVDRSYLRLNP
ncbi:ubiquitin-conjugating enzyme E2 E2 isoform X1 [Pogona vitticeps]